MVGIGGLPYIPLDEHIDVERFKSLELDIMEGLAQCEWPLAVYGPSVKDPEIEHELTEIETLFDERRHNNDPIYLRAQGIQDRTQRRKFLKMATGCYSPGLYRNIAPAHDVALPSRFWSSAL